MSQNDLFGSNAEPGAPRPRQPYNWFFALRPSADDAQRIYERTADLLRLNGFHGKRLAPERLHVSLVWLGPHLLQVQQEAAFLAADSVRFESFELLFDVAMSYTGSNAFVLAGGNHAAQVRSLCAPLEKALRRYGFASLKVSKPHMTLCYDSRNLLTAGRRRTYRLPRYRVFACKESLWYVASRGCTDLAIEQQRRA